MATLTVYPAAGTGGTTFDGYATQRNGTGDTWANIQGGAGSAGQSSATATTLQFWIQSYSTSNRWVLLSRSIILFDTSALGAGATINSATLSLYGTAKINTFSSVSPVYNIYSSNPASNSNIADGDYDSLGTTAFATGIAHADISTSAYNDFVLNASGIAAINKTGITKFGLRDATYDVTGTEPTWEASKDFYFVCSSADQTGTGQDPKLVIDYTPGTLIQDPLCEGIVAFPR